MLAPSALHRPGAGKDGVRNGQKSPYHHLPSGPTPAPRGLGAEKGPCKTSSEVSFANRLKDPGQIMIPWGAQLIRTGRTTPYCSPESTGARPNSHKEDGPPLEMPVV